MIRVCKYATLINMYKNNVEEKRNLKISLSALKKFGIKTPRVLGSLHLSSQRWVPKFLKV